ncbi:hypothetical protein ABOUO_39 [Brevibacillus phage Abouo]|uniref:Uncharacterized protein n=2 Tax=Abouovirus TaxID=1984773 RepID=U5P0M6_9CAUD|nr:hypothetical protein DAVIES_39 [Brevibacillus phage Davies]YP_009220096.1 hypothetical protein AVV45_gp39 [Brevibacillus phage Abouo]AGR47525.1 hypothetical protein ABOUO_39 [Brevibacillus phage Abouo]AGY37133.1 hypothetical protein DAVIES_39 [Brevibacillus phage Davies]
MVLKLKLKTFKIFVFAVKYYHIINNIQAFLSKNDINLLALRVY